VSASRPTSSSTAAALISTPRSAN